MHSQKHFSKLGDKLFPYKGTEHGWQVASDSKNIEYSVWKLKIHCLSAADHWDWPEAEGATVRTAFFFFLTFQNKVLLAGAALLCNDYPSSEFLQRLIPADVCYQTVRDSTDSYTLRKQYSCVTMWGWNEPMKSQQDCFQGSSILLQQKDSLSSSRLVPVMIVSLNIPKKEKPQP